MAKVDETVKMVKVRYLVDRITIKGVEHKDLLGQVVEVEAHKAETLVAHKFVEIVEAEVPNVE